MIRNWRTLTAVLALMLAAPAISQDKKGAAPLEVMTARGSVQAIDKESLTIQPRGAGGKFEKSVTLRLTGTSKVVVLTSQKRGDKVVLVQKEMEAKDLQKGQAVAVIYATAGKDGPVLLSAVAQPLLSN